MAGHSHSKNVRLRKAAVDAKRSKLFTKMAKLITTAARSGGGDPNLNAKLSFAIGKAKSVSLPKETIERAIKKGTGELEGEGYEEILYEGYGPNGVAVICEIFTDNRNRTASEVRKIFDTHGGKLGTTNCVAFMFNRKGRFLVEAEGREEEEMMELALEAGAEDCKRSGDYFEFLCDPNDFDSLGNVLDEQKIEAEEADLVRIAETLVDCDEDVGRKIASLLEKLEDLDDVQSVYSNANIPDAVYAEA
ncbi:putative transcriptional regulatory protein [Planctomycetes bacterium Pan216]|uniref:Probable transcriptional regulatory protein Pan216_19900 n=1 Tax=Kolteria novifilia TaxID=2527975 RepID=A0A518B2I1_9BACT|nr:putative transcriptional regulatory protein [Planctomycetes bacterium Pan216]